MAPAETANKFTFAPVSGERREKVSDTSGGLFNVVSDPSCRCERPFCSIIFKERLTMLMGNGNNQNGIRFDAVNQSIRETGKNEFLKNATSGLHDDRSDPGIFENCLDCFFEFPDKLNAQTRSRHLAEVDRIRQLALCRRQQPRLHFCS
jgi:hypothetical protein